MTPKQCGLTMIRLCSFAIATSLIAVMIGCESDDGTNSPVEVTPSSVTLDASSTSNVVFEASGGLAPYSWKVSDESLGTLATSLNTAVYTRKSTSGINIVTATDTNGYAGTAMIYQDAQ